MFQPNRRRNADPRPLRGPASGPRLEALEDRSVPAVISGGVYHDLNGNGLMEAGETPIANSTIELHNASGAVIGTTISDANGMYEFAVDQTVNTSPGTREEVLTFADARTDVARTGTVQQFDPSLGLLTAVEVISTAGLNYQAQLENLDALTQPAHAEFEATVTVQGPGGLTVSSSVSDRQDVQLDAFDGQPDLMGASGRDLGVKPVTAGPKSVVLQAGLNDLSGFVGTGAVTLSQSAQAIASVGGAGNILGMVRTTAGGQVRVVYHYTPSNGLKPGQYTIVQPNQPPGYIDGMETSGNVTPIPGSNHTDSISVTLPPVGDSTDNCFGEVQPARVAGTVYHDVLGTGRWMGGQAPLGGVALSLTGTNTFGEEVALSTTTAADGSYAFDLWAGTYHITESQPAGFDQGTNTLGSLGGVLTGDTFSLIARAGDNGVGYDFGEVLPPPPLLPPPFTTPPPVGPPPPPPPITTPPMTPPTAPPPPTVGLLPIKLLLTGGGWGGWAW